MRLFLLPVLLVVAVGAALAAAPFAHRTHLRMKLACVTCHGGATTSTGVDDNLLPDPALCQTCHKQVEIPPPPKVRLAHFSHVRHLKAGNAAAAIAAAIDAKTYLAPPGDLRRFLNTTNPCEGCHRGLAESDRVTRTALPQMADCLVCHNVIEMPFSCSKCHEKGANLKPANHTADFLDTHTSGKLNLDKTTCAVCHGRKFTCLGCH